MIKLIKRAVAMLALIAPVAALGFAAPASAQQNEIAPEQLAIARRYVDLTDRVSIYEVSLVETAVQTMRTIISQNPTLVEQVDAAITKTLENYRGRKDELMNQFARVYALTFTMEELQEIVKFYESPIGVKLSTANATLNQSLQEIMQVFQVNLRREFFAQVKANLKEAGYDV